MENKDLTEFSARDVQETPEEVNAVVTNVTFKTSIDVYGANLPQNMPKDEMMLSLSWESAAFEIKGTTNFKFYDKPVPENSKMGKYLKKYNNLMAETVVVVKKNDDGFYRLVFE